MAKLGTLIVLSHQGLSMITEICDAIKKLGFDYIILSSQPTSQINTVDPNKIFIVNKAHLCWEDLYNFYILHSSYINFVGCISVWDGYRELMSQLNQLLNANDISPEKVEILKNKLTFRKTLFSHSLTNISSNILTNDLFEELKSQSGQYFIKPVKGLASFGTTPLNKINTFEDLEILKSNALKDCAYSGVFQSDMQFMYEDFISGNEYCFEVIINHGITNIISIHEKIEIEQQNLSTVEPACICPPNNISQYDIEQGKILIERILKTLEIDAGLYHVEAKYDKATGWELIEINPRIGGAYIFKSTLIHSGINLLELWIQSLQR